MRKFTFLAVMLLTLTLLNCNLDETSNLETQTPNFRVTENTVQEGFLRSSLDEPCTTVTLIAGQHHEAGQVTIDSDGENLIITYSTNPDWTIDLTHLSIGNCNEQWIPTTGSGNPKIGQFEHTEPHTQGTNEVTYLINLDALNEAYCFAAHAEVTGPNGGETAWAEGFNFEGNSWAMYVEAFLSDCEVEEEDGTK